MEKKKELETLELMIKKYCRGNHGSARGGMCPDCRELFEYACFRREKCPHGDNKPFCSNCPIHCYKPDMKEKIRLVMQYSGPRMMFDHPVVAISHLVETKREKKRLKVKQSD